MPPMDPLECTRKFTCGTYLLLRVMQTEDPYLQGNDPYLHLNMPRSEPQSPEHLPMAVQLM